MKQEELLTLPNIISFIRLMMAPFLFVFMYMEKYVNRDQNTLVFGLLAALVFLFAALSDILDGYLARKTGQVTDMGKFLDPLADKVMVTTALIMLVSLDRCPAWIALVIILREIIITGFRSMAQTRGQVIAASKLGKLKTLFQSIALVALLVHHNINIGELWGSTWKIWTINFHVIGTFFLYIAVFFTLYSGYDYIAHFVQNEAAQENQKTD